MKKTEGQRNATVLFRDLFILPDHPTVTKTRCITLVVPDDNQHLAAFLGAIQLLTKWNSWARDDARNGRLAAQTWKDVLGSQKLFEACKTQPIIINEEIVDMNLCDFVRYHDGKLQLLCCGVWEDVPGSGDGEAPPGRQPGPVPGPGPGASKCYSALLPASGVWRLPFAVSDGDTVVISQANGGWNDGSIDGWFCPDGGNFVLGGCFGTGSLAGGDPASTISHMRLVYQAGGVWFDGYNTTIVLSGVGTNQFIDFQANDGSLSDNQGSTTFKVCVTSGSTPPPTSWCYLFDFALADYSSFFTLAYGLYNPGEGYINNAGGVPAHVVELDLNVLLAYGLRHVEIDCYSDEDHTGDCFRGIYLIPYPDHVQSFPCGTTGNYTMSFDVDSSFVGLAAFQNSNGGSSGTNKVFRIRFSGDGDNPFGTDNC